ncbi:hypothetical protein [Loktanella sp. 5RATIMAR09]|uniref:hypothetical protein n=1 Tax=Loktanella sp. 5RATIMAR09 TaxID=1225655 RepID=UPI000B32504A|nr:hypothetical protein [Loktanella sp. 5RATIMAR09]
MDQEVHIRIGHLRVQTNSFLEEVSSFVQPAVFYQEDPDGIGLDSNSKGTVFLLRYRSLNYAICTRHQFRNDNAPGDLPDHFSLLLGTKNLGHSPDDAQFVSAGGSDSLSDIFVATYRDERDGVDVTKHFGPFELIADHQSKCIRYFTVGLPTDQRSMDLQWDDETCSYDTEHKLRYSFLYLEPVVGEPMDLEHRIAMCLSGSSKNHQIEPDGLSGSPVFGILQTEIETFSIVFVGFITHGRCLSKVTADRPQRFLVYPVEPIRKVLDAIVDGKSEA